MVIASCVENSSEYKKLQDENETLRLEKIKSIADLDDMIAALNDIQTDIQAIREAENYLSIEQQGELSKSQQEKIKEDILLIARTLKINKEKLAALEEKLKNSDDQLSGLQKTIERLNAELAQKTLMIASLQAELAKKNVLILDLQEDLKNLLQATTLQAQQLSEQEKELYLAYYCYGTKKELKEQAILTGGGLFSKAKALQGGFNKDYFVRIDMREETEFPLFTRKAKLHSNHPVKSYLFEKDQNGNLTLVVLEPDLFWSLSRYLVIEVG
jgi:DNA repair exonuclease SbcCD ATPase subunit